MPADVGVDRVDSELFGLAGHQRDLVPRLSTLDEVGDGLAQDDREVTGDLATRLGDDLDEETLSVLGGATPPVGAIVGVRAQELIDQIPLTAHDLDGVISRAAGQLGRRTERADDVFDDRFGHLEVFEWVDR